MAARLGIAPTPAPPLKARGSVLPPPSLVPAAQFTPARQVRFLDFLSQEGNVRAACGRVGISRECAYRLKRRGGAFARGWGAALALARDAAAEVLADRALNGVTETIWYRGELVGERRRFDSRLLLAHIARLDRSAYSERAATADAGRFDELLGRIAGVEPDPALIAPFDPMTDEEAPLIPCERAAFAGTAMRGAQYAAEYAARLAYRRDEARAELERAQVERGERKRREFKDADLDDWELEDSEPDAEEDVAEPSAPMDPEVALFDPEDALFDRGAEPVDPEVAWAEAAAAWDRWHDTALARVDAVLGDADMAEGAASAGAAAGSVPAAIEVKSAGEPGRGTGEDVFALDCVRCVNTGRGQASLPSAPRPAGERIAQLAPHGAGAAWSGGAGDREGGNPSPTAASSLRSQACVSSPRGERRR